MAKTTSNYGLTKPDPSDFYDIEVFNRNWDKIDLAMVGKFAKKLTSADDLNAIRESGNYYWIGVDIPQNAPPHSSNLTHMRVSGYPSVPHATSNTDHCYQEVIAINPSSAYGNCSVRRVLDNNEIGHWEWINPPMYPSVEYRTVERHEDEAVYVKLDFDGIIHKRTESGIDITPITYGTTDLTVGSALPTGQLYLVYE